MKTIIKYFAWAALLAFCAGCKPKSPDPEDKPRILSLYFREIPTEDVTVDQEKLVITVKAPAHLTTGEIIPYVELTRQAELKPVDWRGLFYENCPDCRKLELFDKNDPLISQSSGGAPPSTYTVTLLPAGPLTIDAAGIPDDFDPRDYYLKPNEYGHGTFFVPVRNLYGNALPLRANFTNLETKETFVVQRPPDTNELESSFFVQGAFARTNQLGIRIPSFEGKLPPGPYQVELTMKNNQVLTVPKPITLKPGRLWVANGYMGYEDSRVQPGGTFLLTGGDLYADNIIVELIDSLDRATRLTVVEVIRDGEHALVRLPPSLAYDHYVMRIRDITGQFEFCYVVHSRPGKLAANEILWLGSYQTSCSIKEPLLFSRDQKNYVSVNSVASKTRLKLVPIQDSTKTYFAESELRFATQLGESAFVRFPSNIPAGKYLVSLQVLDESGKVTQQGPAYRRLVEIK